MPGHLGTVGNEHRGAVTALSFPTSPIRTGGIKMREDKCPLIGVMETPGAEKDLARKQTLILKVGDHLFSHLFSYISK